LKTLKPGNISLYTAFLISGVVTAICMVLLWLFQVTAFLWISLALLPVVFLCSLLFIRYALNTYFYRNIHVIYKNILQLKGIPSTAMVKPVSDENVLVEVNKILIDWEKGNKEEIVHLKELETYRKEFLGNVSHELKTPIFTIQGYIHTLIDGGIEDQDINMLYLQKASKSIDRLISIVDDLESISRL
jgi:two-component system phosphate regulon sensor histidine kinase PhoR